MPIRKNYVGHIFGDFTVTEMLYGYKKSGNKARTYCKCVGIDNKEYIIRLDALTSGSTKHIKGANAQYTDLSGEKFGKLTVVRPTNKRASNGSVIWHCKCDCGNECDVSRSKLLSNHTRSCGCRHQSKWVDLIEDILMKMNIKYDKEKRFNDCKNKKGTDMLPFDFYLPSFNAIIEYDGEHHYIPIDGWGGEEKYHKVLENDEIKNNYCDDNNIELLRIPYTKTKEEIIDMIKSFVVRNDHTLKGND